MKMKLKIVVIIKLQAIGAALTYLVILHQFKAAELERRSTTTQPSYWRMVGTSKLLNPFNELISLIEWKASIEEFRKRNRKCTAAYLQTTIQITNSQDIKSFHVFSSHQFLFIENSWLDWHCRLIQQTCSMYNVINKKTLMFKKTNIN